MKIAFVGMKRAYAGLAPEYRDRFNQFHLELPYYYARDGRNDVTLTTLDYDDKGGYIFPSDDSQPVGSLVCRKEIDFRNDPRTQYDVVVHWRKWYPELYRPEAINMIHCQDHSFSPDWQRDAREAFKTGQLHGIICYPTWHRKNLLDECPWLPMHRAIAGLTFGVDTDVYHPSVEKDPCQKDPYQMLWASDPGRGLSQAIGLAIKLFSVDRRFRLHVCHPDYSPAQAIQHPAIVWHGNVDNGPELFKLFNECGVLPYTSTFNEPSSRAHRQAQAAGSLVLYPPNRGSPSDLIPEASYLFGEVGVVSDPSEWAGTIMSMINDGSWKTVGQNARRLAIAENWAVQAARFNSYFNDLLQKGNV